MTMFPLIVIGTYEEFVLGYNPKYENEPNKKCKLIQTFATHSHQASVRCLASHNNLMASSGADEYINIYDMIAMEVSTVINYHNSTVTCLEFTPDGTHLVTANQNGDIAIFRCRDWTLVKLWKEAHKHANGVTSINVHPSGSLLMTTGADNIVRFWNLVKGRQAYATNFSKKCSVANSVNFGMWSKNGNYYAVCIGNKVEIYTTEKAAVVYEINTKTRITCATFTKKNLFCLGTEDGSVEIHSIIQGKLLVEDQFHKTRVKSLSSFSLDIHKNEKNKLQNYIISADSKGGIKLWQLKKKELNYSVELKSEADCDCRITCLTLVAVKDVKEEKKDLPAPVNSTETTDNIVVENKVNNQPASDKQKNSLKKKLKQSKDKSRENGKCNNNSTPQTNGKSKRGLPITETPVSVVQGDDSTMKRKKRKLCEDDFGEKHKEMLNGSSGSVKHFNKKILTNSFSSGKNQKKRKSGKWLVEGV